MAKVKRLRPSRLLLYFAIFASFVNCVFIIAVIFSHRRQNKRFSEFLSKVPAREAQPLEKLASGVVSTNRFPRLPSLSRFEELSTYGSEFSPSPYAVVRPPRTGSDLAQVITHDGEMRWVKYSELPPAWRKSK